MGSGIDVLSRYLGLPNTNLASAVMTYFYDYVNNFLQHNRDVLDPHLPHIQLRILLAAEHPSAGWRWTQQGPEAKQTWDQDEHATVFVQAVLQHPVADRYCPGDCSPARPIHTIHQWLCMLQSVWLGNGVWVDDGQLQTQLRDALMEVMWKIELTRASYPVGSDGLPSLSPALTAIQLSL
ncbi:hypothetical protein BT67DRAFT_485845 [Trichocladium antarcticum]|uniref:Uncharacterized protein n=1 Tax=Trichocladium antarcticum TaxID=1450529 RepID=A0AAN6ZBQ9_9PEZI|nr:hypothetical protein BT67DRAFT_485845 [Trichocladium antarcticum]